MNQHIQSTVTTHHQSLIVEKDSVYDKLKVLSSHFSINLYYWIWQLFQRWHSLIKTPHSQNLHNWLEEWKSFLVEAKETGCPGLESKTYDWESIFGFIDVIHPLEPIFAANCEKDLQKNENLIIQEIITHYQDHLQDAQGSENIAKASFATLEDMQSSDSKSSNSKSSKGSSQSKEKDWASQCVCGSYHQFEWCYYIVESLHHPKWKPKSHIEVKFVKKQENPTLLAKFNEIHRKANLSEWSVQSANSIMYEDSQEVYSVIVSAFIQPSNDL